jgi:hypothetical protein
VRRRDRPGAHCIYLRCRGRLTTSRSNALRWHERRLRQHVKGMPVRLSAMGLAGDPLEIVGSRASHLWEALSRAYEVLGFDLVLDGDEVVRDLVLARIIEPTSKADALRCSPRPGWTRFLTGRSSGACQ